MLVAFLSLGLPQRDGLSSTLSGTDVLSPSEMQNMLDGTDVLSPSEMKNVLDQPSVPATEELGEQQAMSSSCPSNVKGILYNHIPKTGGTLINHLLKAVFEANRDPDYVYQVDNRGSTSSDSLNHTRPTVVLEGDTLRVQGNPVPIEAADGKDYFVIGLVRRPCDYTLSQWVEKSNEAKAKGTLKPWRGSMLKEPILAAAQLATICDLLGGSVALPGFPAALCSLVEPCGAIDPARRGWGAATRPSQSHSFPAFNTRSGTSSHMDSEADKAKFNMYVGHNLNLTERTSDTLGLEATSPNAPFMSVGTRLRGYDSAMDGGYMHCVRVESARLGRRRGTAQHHGLLGGRLLSRLRRSPRAATSYRMLPDETVPATPISLLPRRHCVMQTHTVLDDFKKCIKQYENCGRAPGFTRGHAWPPPPAAATASVAPAGLMP